MQHDKALPSSLIWMSYEQRQRTRAKSLLRLTNSTDNWKNQLKMERLNQNLTAALVTSFETPRTSWSPTANGWGHDKGPHLHSHPSPVFPTASPFPVLTPSGFALLPYTTAFTTSENKEKQQPMSSGTLSQKKEE